MKTSLIWLPHCFVIENDIRLKYNDRCNERRHQDILYLMKYLTNDVCPKEKRNNMLSLSFRTVLCYAVYYTPMSSYMWIIIIFIRQYSSRQLKDINTIQSAYSIRVHKSIETKKENCYLSWIGDCWYTFTFLLFCFAFCVFLFLVLSLF